MVAKITFPRFVIGALNYNEQKVQKSVAECIGAGNVLSEVHKMNFHQKLAVFENLNALNERASTKTIHVSLNFSPTEKLNKTRLMAIAESYMEKIGFGEQPYFVYQHLDAGHPHLHIVSTTIRQDGSRINTHNIGRNQSEKARKEIEQEFGLVPTEQQKKELVIRSINAKKVVYGKHETKRSIANVVNSVINQYNYTSFAQFNAVLKQYNVVADRGETEGRIYKHGGLVYRVLDEAGNKIGVPIKASAINSKPTLVLLEQKFEVNKGKREEPKQLLKKILDEVLQLSPASMQELMGLLAKKNVYTVLRQNEEGRIYGITLVDNQNKAVFNGSEIGKAYSIASIQQHFYKTQPLTKEMEERMQTQSVTHNPAFHQPSQNQPHFDEGKDVQKDNLLQYLITPEITYENVPAQLLKKNRRRKKKDRNL
ncbi:relaxase [Ilyomonas limi]|uniref:Relaxase n=1 Tax=Ilyomonas limi TaxID=2575867 RepID=A0A4U3KRE5_9BACT|nr:relaxase/mobilization nuclease domain-containing protein [Ilyomonas limi]TKK64860.1 relaxase [Ilyomonas limi]